MKKFIRYISFIIAILLLGILTISAIGSAYIKERTVDYSLLDKVINYNPITTGFMLDIGGNVIAQLGEQNREYVKFEGIPDLVIDAFVSAEDKNFWLHNGVDSVAIAKAIVSNMFFREGKRPLGASTITQQVVKNIVTGQSQSFSNKVDEALFALELERNLDKKKILEIYLNEIYFGRGTYGIVSAADKYFRKSVADLSLGEAGFLAGLPKAPSFYSNNKKDAEVRKQYILGQMLKNGHITPDEYANAMGVETDIVSSPSTNSDRDTHYKNLVLTKLGKVVPTNEINNISSVETFLNSPLQMMVEQQLLLAVISYQRRQETWLGVLVSREYPLQDTRVLWGVYAGENKVLVSGSEYELAEGEREWIAQSGQLISQGDELPLYLINKKAFLYQKTDLQGAVIIANPKDGGVLALTGAVDEQKSSFDRATMANRQPGSMIKPFLYATALDNGWTPATPILDGEIGYSAQDDEIWKPKDHSYSNQGYITFRRALETSRNTVTLRLYDILGSEKVHDVMQKLHLYDESPNDITFALGSKETTLEKLVSAYMVIASDGFYKPLRVIKNQNTKGVIQDNLY